MPYDDAATPTMPTVPTEPVRTRGRYVYRFAGAVVPVDERFVLGQVGDGVRVRATRVAAHPTVRLEATVTYRPSRPVAAALRWTGSSPGIPASAEATIAADNDRVRTERIVDGRYHLDESVRGELLPLLRVFAGPVVVATSEPGGRDVVVPDIRDPGRPATLFAPLVDRRTAELLGEREVVVDGVARGGRAYRAVGGAYGERGAEFVVDEGGLLLGYTWDQPRVGAWDVRLDGLTGPWPTPARWRGLA